MKANGRNNFIKGITDNLIVILFNNYKTLYNMEDSAKELFLAIGLDPKVVESTLKNKKVTQRLKEVIELAGIKEANKTVGNLLYGVATKMPETTFIHTKFFIDQVLGDKI